MRLFPPSTVPHPWRQTLAILALAVWTMVAVYYTVQGPLLWLVRLGGPLPWSWVHVSA